ncbi:PAS domain S-box protein [Methanolobus vulcani]|uniref:histidine kinase n=1 Tax=Methanolobus vulcani TaxID=38026 RepID=A0A7Z8P1M2_9EURY|nr:PAS domain S-box protein [Methanolobus vulcani]TQD24901.1 PAS domain S-box protein [Methanolobus vulcani]
MDEKTGYTVLIVDDDPLNVKLLNVFLSKHHSVLGAYSGEEALKIMESVPVDLVILDIMMPGMDGYEVCRRIKANESTKFIPVIVVTALSSKNDRIKGIDAGADEFLVKPIDRVEVLTRVRTLLNNKHLYDELKSERDRVQSYLDIAGCIIVAFDKDGTVKLANKKCCQLLGYTEDELIGQNWVDIAVYDDEKERVSRVFERVSNGNLESVKVNENGVLTKNKEQRIIRWNNSYLKDSDGTIIGTLSSGIDVTEERLATKKLRESEHKFRLLAENANDVIWTMTKDGRFTYTSPSVSKLRGYTPEEVAKQPLEEIFPREHIEKILDAMARFHDHLKAGKRKYSETFEIEQYHKDGSRIWTEAIATPVFDEDGTFEFFLGVTRDISERKRADEEIKRYTAELTRMNEELKTLDRMKDEFISNLSHELKTPLISIKGYSELVHDEVMGPLNSRQKAAMKTVLDKYDHLSFLMDSLLYMSIVKSGKVKYRLDPVRIEDTLKKVVDYFSFRSQEKDLIMVFDFQEHLPLMKGDVEYLPYLFRSIIDNAVKFSPNGSEVLVRAFEDKDNVHVMVSDYGIGIPEHEIENIFKRFYQIDSSKSRKYGGSGMGLYVSKTIAEIHGGKIWVESSEGTGTTVHVIFPAMSRSN